MIKKTLFSVAATITLMTSSLFATSSDYDIALQMARVKQVDTLVDKIKTDSTYISQYVLETADISPTILEIDSFYGLDVKIWNNFDGQQMAFSFDYTNNKLVINKPFQYTADKYSPIVISSFINNINLPSTTANVAIDKIEIMLPFETVSFARKVDDLITNDSNNSSVGLIAPTNTVLQWYKPDGKGNLELFIFDSTKNEWVSSGISQKGNIVVTSVADLDKLKVQTGETAMVIANGSQVGVEYMYSGDRWVMTSSTTSSGGTSATSTNNVISTEQQAAYYLSSKLCNLYSFTIDRSSDYPVGITYNSSFLKLLELGADINEGGLCMLDKAVKWHDYKFIESPNLKNAFKTIQVATGSELRSFPSPCYQDCLYNFIIYKDVNVTNIETNVWLNYIQYESGLDNTFEEDGHKTFLISKGINLNSLYGEIFGINKQLIQDLIDKGLDISLLSKLKESTTLLFHSFTVNTTHDHLGIRTLASDGSMEYLYSIPSPLNFNPQLAIQSSSYYNTYYDIGSASASEIRYFVTNPTIVEFLFSKGYTMTAGIRDNYFNYLKEDYDSEFAARFMSYWQK